MNSMQFESLGTHWEIEADRISESLEDKVLQRLEQFDATYSRFRKDSVVWQMSQSSGDYTLPDDAAPLIRFYQELYELSDGHVSPLVGDILEAAGYDHSYSLKQSEPAVPAPTIGETFSYNEPVITMHTPALLDFGAAGKGYAADIIAQLLRENGCNEFIIDASGDILRKSSQQTTIRIGLENPLDTTQVLGFCELGNEAICASGVTKRKWQDWHHIVDPTKAQPTTRILATWAIASNCMEADGIATALFMVKPEVISEKHVFDYLILFDDKSARYSPTFPGKVFV